MPFQSKAQRRYFFAKMPRATARLWAAHTPDPASLPERKHERPKSRHEKDAMNHSNPESQTSVNQQDTGSGVPLEGLVALQLSFDRSSKLAGLGAGVLGSQQIAQLKTHAIKEMDPTAPPRVPMKPAAVPAPPGIVTPGAMGSAQPGQQPARPGMTPGFQNPMPGAPNPLGAGSLAYGGMRAPGMGNAFKAAAISFHRELNPTEQADIDSHSKNWLPRAFASGGTPLPETMASPAKGAVLEGGLGALLAGAAGYGLGKATGQDPNIFAAGGALAGGSLGAAHGFQKRKIWNEDATDLMRRLPEGATYRDYQSDAGDGYGGDSIQNLRAVRYLARDMSEKSSAVIGAPPKPKLPGMTHLNGINPATAFHPTNIMGSGINREQMGAGQGGSSGVLGSPIPKGTPYPTYKPTPRPDSPTTLSGNAAALAVRKQQMASERTSLMSRLRANGNDAAAASLTPQSAPAPAPAGGPSLAARPGSIPPSDSNYPTYYDQPSPAAPAPAPARAALPPTNALNPAKGPRPMYTEPDTSPDYQPQVGYGMTPGTNVVRGKPLSYPAGPYRNPDPNPNAPNRWNYLRSEDVPGVPSAAAKRWDDLTPERQAEFHRGSWGEQDLQINEHTTPADMQKYHEIKHQRLIDQGYATPQYLSSVNGGTVAGQRPLQTNPAWAAQQPQARPYQGYSMARPGTWVGGGQPPALARSSFNLPVMAKGGSAPEEAPEPPTDGPLDATQPVMKPKPAYTTIAGRQIRVMGPQTHRNGRFSTESRWQKKGFNLLKYTPAMIGAAETGVDTLASGINNPEHPGRAMGRALATGVGTTGGILLGGHLGERTGHPYGELIGSVLGAVGGGVGGTLLGRALTPSPARIGEEEEEEPIKHASGFLSSLFPAPPRTPPAGAPVAPPVPAAPIPGPGTRMPRAVMPAGALTPSPAHISNGANAGMAIGSSSILGPVAGGMMGGLAGHVHSLFAPAPKPVMMPRAAAAPAPVTPTRIVNPGGQKVAAMVEGVTPGAALALGTLGTMGLVGGVGAGMAPSGHRMEGGYRAVSHLGSVARMGIPGAMLGGLAGSPMGPAGAAVGAAVGGIGGGLVGDSLWNWNMPQPTWERNKKDKPQTTDEDNEKKAASKARPKDRAGSRAIGRRHPPSTEALRPYWEGTQSKSKPSRNPFTHEEEPDRQFFSMPDEPRAGNRVESRDPMKRPKARPAAV